MKKKTKDIDPSKYLSIDGALDGVPVGKLWEANWPDALDMIYANIKQQNITDWENFRVTQKRYKFGEEIPDPDSKVTGRIVVFNNGFGTATTYSTSHTDKLTVIGDPSQEDMKGGTYFTGRINPPGQDEQQYTVTNAATVVVAEYAIPYTTQEAQAHTFTYCGQVIDLSKWYDQSGNAGADIEGIAYLHDDSGGGTYYPPHWSLQTGNASKIGDEHSTLSLSEATPRQSAVFDENLQATDASKLHYYVYENGKGVAKASMLNGLVVNMSWNMSADIVYNTTDGSHQDFNGSVQYTHTGHSISDASSWIDFDVMVIDSYYDDTPPPPPSSGNRFDLKLPIRPRSDVSAGKVIPKDQLPLTV